ncbi:MAG: hypothetical protein ABIP48_17790 [Planctomycetota bacterium]
MIRIASKPSSKGKAEAWHAEFLKMSSVVQRKASFAGKDLSAEAREDFVEEVVAYAVVAFKALWDRGTPEVAYPTVLARYGIRQARIGRKVGLSLNVRDVSSEYCHWAKGVTLERLDKTDHETGEWLEILVEDRRAGPAETAAARIDVADWFDSLPPRDRRIAKALAAGHTTGEVARQFQLSPGRISQMRREYFNNWAEFQGDTGKTADLGNPRADGASCQVDRCG